MSGTSNDGQRSQRFLRLWLAHGDARRVLNDRFVVVLNPSSFGIALVSTRIPIIPAQVKTRQRTRDLAIARINTTC